MSPLSLNECIDRFIRNAHGSVRDLVSGCTSVQIFFYLDGKKISDRVVES